MCDIGKSAQFINIYLKISYFKMAKTTKDIFFLARKKSVAYRKIIWMFHHMAGRRYWTYCIHSRDWIKLTASNHGKYLVSQQRQTSLSTRHTRADSHKSWSTAWITMCIQIFFKFIMGSWIRCSSDIFILMDPDCGRQ